MTMKQVEEEYKKLMDEIGASKERVESEARWKSRCKELAKINKEQQKLNGKLRKENDALITVIDLAKEHINKKLEHLEMNKRAIMSILTPQNGYLKADVEFAIREKQELLEILERVNE